MVVKICKDEDVLNRFIDVELLVALLGGVSAAVLFLVFAWLSAPFRAALYVGVFVIGLMVGMEIPLVMRVFNQRKAEFREIVSRVLTFDYLGALAVSLVFPLLLAPKLGLLRTSFLFGMLNAGVALWTTWLFRAEVRRPAERAVRGGVVLGLLTLGFVYSGHMTAWAERACTATTWSMPRPRPTSAWWSRAGTTTCACTSTATCNSPRATSTATTRPWCIPACWPCPGPATYWCWAAATGWRCARFSSTRTSNTSRWWTWTRP